MLFVLYISRGSSFFLNSEGFSAGFIYPGTKWCGMGKSILYIINTERTRCEKYMVEIRHRKHYISRICCLMIIQELYKIGSKRFVSSHGIPQNYNIACLDDRNI